MSASGIAAQGVCAAKGFRAAGVVSHIKKSGLLDLALIVSDAPAAVAGTFTTNRAAAAPVRVSRERIAAGKARGVVVNSGCANACTGKRGYEDAIAMADEAARVLGVGPSEMLVCSTGKIGAYLPMEKVKAGIAMAAGALDFDDEQTAKAIMTTDTRPKRAAVLHPDGWAVGGIAKGAGMIAPDMATMLAFITTDAHVDRSLLKSLLSEAVGSTFNSITIDGDTSTNDTVLAFANGASGIAPDSEGFASALFAVCRSLAEQIVADGEGATKFIEVRVAGAAHEEDAKRAARAVAESLLVKTALFGGDPNWGRIAAAIGYSQVEADLDRITIAIAGHELVSAGEPAPDEMYRRARIALKEAGRLAIECYLSAGGASAEVLTTDLSPDYVHLNAEYET